jgi:2-C-methyl-D-erythritol 4-phosphate cytidylyltransferase
MIAAIIVAAGQGTRMGPKVNKLFVEINGLPLVAHAWLTYDHAADIEEIILVIRAGLEDQFIKLGETIAARKTFRLVAGGEHRQDSVWQGLQALSPGVELVAIHDGARPCVTHQLITATLAAARECGAGVAAQRVTDTVKETNDGQYIARHLDRSRLWAVQTPQSFRVDIIRRALAEVRSRHLQVTDDTAACELVGQRVRLVESRSPNPKATTPADLQYIELLLRHRTP